MKLNEGERRPKDKELKYKEKLGYYFVFGPESSQIIKLYSL